MADELTYIGSVTVGASIPGALAAIALAIPDLQARIDALVAFSPAAINLSADLAVAVGMVANITAAISLGITPPSISAQIAIVLGLLADLQARLAAIAAFSGLCASAGVHAYKYDGTAAGIGATLTTELASGYPGGSGPSEHSNAIVLATTSGATWSAMVGVFVM